MPKKSVPVFVPPVVVPKAPKAPKAPKPAPKKK